MWVGCWQIEKDLLRTMPSNVCFASVSSIGVPRLRRVLRALAWLYPEIGYCQGTGMVSTSWRGKGVSPHWRTVPSWAVGWVVGLEVGVPVEGRGCQVCWFQP